MNVTIVGKLIKNGYKFLHTKKCEYFYLIFFMKMICVIF